MFSALGLLALGVSGLLWWRGYSYGAAGRAAALLSIALFAALGLRFVPRWVDFWSPGGGEERLAPAGEEPPGMALRIFAALLALDAFVLLSAWLLRRLMGTEGGFVETLEFWTCADSRHYLDIARDWYLSEGSRDRLVQLVFLPGYPLLVRLGMLVTGDALLAGLLTSALCFAAAGVLLYRLLRLDVEHRTALRGLLFLCLMPGSFFFAAPMSESLFLLLCLGCLYLARKGRWALGCLCGALAAFTRSLGLTLLAPLLLELVHDYARGRAGGRRTALRALALLLVPLGFAAYLWVNWRVSGDPFRFLVYQREHWGQRMGLFFNTAAYQTEQAAAYFGASREYFWGLWLPNLLCSFGSLSLLAASAPRLRASGTAWAIGYFVLAIGPTWLLSAPRYLAALPVLPAALALLTEKRGRFALAAGLLAPAWTMYFLAFLQRWQVW